MSNLLNLTDAINEGFKSGKTPTFIYEGTTYEFSPAGLIAFLTAEGGFAPELTFTVPTSDPGVAGEVWNDAGVLKASAGV